MVIHKSCYWTLTLSKGDRASKAIHSWIKGKAGSLQTADGCTKVEYIIVGVSILVVVLMGAFSMRVAEGRRWSSEACTM